MSFLGKAIDTLIVITAVYAGAATVVSFVNEAVASLLQTRGKLLKAGILHLVFHWSDIVDDIYEHPLIQAGTSNFGRPGVPSYVDARNFSLAFWQRLQDSLGGADQQTAATLAAAPSKLVADLQQRVAAIDPSTPGAGPLKSTLGTMLTRAEGDYEKLLTLTDDWFNRQMDRISGWYRRKMQWWILALSFLLAFMFSIDTIRIATYLNASDQFRTNITKAIEEKSQLNKAFDAKALDQALMATQVPLDHFVATDRDSMFEAFQGPGPWHLSNHFLGTLITALALTLGAPFWFDALSTLINVRMAGNKPAAPSPAQTSTTNTSAS